MAANPVPAPKRRHKYTSRGRRAIAWFFIVVMSCQISACSYYRVSQGAIPGLRASMQTREVPQTFIIHSGEDVYQMDNLLASHEAIYGEIKTVEQPFYYNEARRKWYNATEKSIINEVHIYVDPAFEIEAGNTYVPERAIQEIRIIDRDHGKVAVIIFAVLMTWVVLGMLTDDGIDMSPIPPKTGGR